MTTLSAPAAIPTGADGAALVDPADFAVVVAPFTVVAIEPFTVVAIAPFAVVVVADFDAAAVEDDSAAAVVAAGAAVVNGAAAAVLVEPSFVVDAVVVEVAFLLQPVTSNPIATTTNARRAGVLLVFVSMVVPDRVRAGNGGCGVSTRRTSGTS